MSFVVVTCASRVDAVISVGLPLYRWNIFGRPSSTFIIIFSLCTQHLEPQMIRTPLAGHFWDQ